MRAGLVGTGWWALGTPGPALAASAVAELVGVWGRDPGKTRSAARQLHCEPFDDIDELIDAVDAVAFAVPPDAQQPLALHAARRGRHLLLEKPLAFTTAAADELLDAIEAAGVAALVFLTDTYRPELDASRHTEAGQTWFGGRATIFVAAPLEPGGLLHESTWRVERGALWDAGPHAISPLLDVLGPVTDVAALEGARRTTQAVLRHARTASSTVSTTLSSPPRAEVWEVSWYGTGGWHHRPPSHTPSPDAYAAAITDLTEAIATGVPTRSTPQHARDVVAVLEAIDAARATARTVAVTPPRASW